MKTSSLMEYVCVCAYWTGREDGSKQGRNISHGFDDSFVN